MAHGHLAAKQPGHLSCLLHDTIIEHCRLGVGVKRIHGSKQLDLLAQCRRLDEPQRTGALTNELRIRIREEPAGKSAMPA